LIFDERCLKCSQHAKNKLTQILPTIEFKNIDVTPNEFLSTEITVKDIGRFDIFLTTEYGNKIQQGRVNIMFELKIDSKISSEQSIKYANWMFQNHPNDINILIYILPKLLSDSKATVGDERWYCMDYQLLNDKVLAPILEHPNLNNKVQQLIIQYMKNLKIRHKGIKMAITNEEKKLAVELYEKYSDVFDSIFDALLEANIIEYSTSDIPLRGRKTGKLAVRINKQVFEGNSVRELFEKILEYLVESNIVKKIPLPWGEGKIRYIISNEAEPQHPNGRAFFLPVKYKGYSMETHYSRERALAVLDSLCNKLEIEYELIDV